MKKRNFVLTVILICILSGCAVKTPEKYPSYFRPIVDILDENWDGIRERQDGWNLLNRIQEVTCAPELMNGGSQKDGIFVCYIHEDDAYYNFDLKEYFSGMEEDWNWNTEGVMRQKDGTTTTVCWYDFDPDNKRKPDLVFVEFDNSNPESFRTNVYAAETEEEFGWYIDCYQLGDNIYVKSQERDDNLKAFSMSGEVTSLEDEWKMIENYAQNNQLTSTTLRCMDFSAVYEEQEVRVFAAQIRESTENYPASIVFMAVQDEKPIAYMTVNCLSKNFKNSIQLNAQRKE